MCRPPSSKKSKNSTKLTSEGVLCIVYSGGGAAQREFLLCFKELLQHFSRFAELIPSSKGKGHLIGRKTISKLSEKCSTRIPDPDFFLNPRSRILGTKKQRILDTDPQHWIRMISNAEL
jgi:hypothetical protein